MKPERATHSPLLQGTISYTFTPEERRACWARIDTSVHPALPHLVQAHVDHLDGDDNAARASMDTALGLVDPTADPDLFVLVLTNEAKIFATSQGANEAIRRLARVLDHLHRVAPGVRMAAHWRLGFLYRTAGHLAEAFKHIAAASREATENGWAYDMALLTSEMGSLHIETGDPVKAIGCYEEAHHTLSRVGDTHMADRILLNLALAHGRIGETDTAESLMEEAVARQREAGEFRHLAGGLLNLAALKKRIGKLDESEAIYDEMLQRTKEAPPGPERVRALIGAASIHNQKGENHEALVLLDQARAVADAGELEVMVLDVDSKRADVYRDLGNTDQALALLHETFEALRRHSYTRFTVQVGALLEQWLVEQGQQDKAYAVLKACSDLQKEVYEKESERALELNTVRQTMESERRDLQLREEERRKLLHQVLPLPIAERIMAGEQRIAEQLDMVGVLFADIVGFTQFAAGKAPGEVLESLESLFRDIDALIMANRCEKVKTIGDSYMATSGTTVEGASEDPTQAVARLVRCGLEMLELLDRPMYAHVQLRVGMHVGPVVAGVMSGMRLAYDMWGDTVNVASRMESTSKAGRFQVTQEVADLLSTQNEFSITPREAISIRGRGQMQTYWVERGS